MFQQKKLGIVLALLLTVILTLTGCTNSSINKAVDNAKAFTDQNNFGQASQTLHAAEKELGSNLGPNELKALSNAYSYIVIKIVDNAKTEAANGNFEKAFADINMSGPIINLPPSMSFSPEAIESAQSARREIADKCLKAALNNNDLTVSVQLFNTASRDSSLSITPEIQKMFDNARIKITEGPAITTISNCETGNIMLAEEAISAVDNLDTNISNAQSDKIIEAKNILQTKQIQSDIDISLGQAELFPVLPPPENSLYKVAVNTYLAIAKIYNEPVYRESITEKQKQHYNSIAIRLNKKLKDRIGDSNATYLYEYYGRYILPVFPIQ